MLKESDQRLLHDENSFNKSCDLHSSNPSQRSDRVGGSLHDPTLQICDANGAFMNDTVCLTSHSLGH